MLEDALPGRLSFTTVRDRATSTKDVNEMIRRLDMYRGEGLAFVPNPYGTGFITQAQLDIAEREAAQENRRRKRALEMAERGAEAEGRLPTDMTSALRPVSPGIYTSTQSDPIANLMYGRRIGDQTARWQARYLQALNDVLTVLPSMSYDMETYQDLTDSVYSIMSIVQSLSPEQYYYAQLVFPVLSISITTDIALFIQGIEEVRATWESFRASL